MRGFAPDLLLLLRGKRNSTSFLHSYLKDLERHVNKAEDNTPPCSNVEGQVNQLVLSVSHKSRNLMMVSASLHKRAQYQGLVIEKQSTDRSPRRAGDGSSLIPLPLLTALTGDGGDKDAALASPTTHVAAAATRFSSRTPHRFDEHHHTTPHDTATARTEPPCSSVAQLALSIRHLQHPTTTIMPPTRDEQALLVSMLFTS